MTFSIPPVDALFPVTVVADTQSTAARQHAHDEANRRRQQHAHPETPAPAEPAARPDPESHPTAGTLLDVKA
jgi:hypothetical protein